jgi:hypothetical protein
MGVDLAPSPIIETPPNCRFELDDINMGLSHFYGQFDFVHMRCVAAGVRTTFTSWAKERLGVAPLTRKLHPQIRSYTTTALEVAKCVKPGGVLMLIEGDFNLLHEDQVTFQEMNCPQYPHASWMARFFHGKLYGPF